MNPTAEGTTPELAPATPDRISVAAWLWDRLRSAGKPVALGQLINAAREAGILPTPGQDEPKPKLTLLYRGRKWVASAHVGWHVAQTEAPGFGGKTIKLWSLAQGPDPEVEPDYDALRRSIDLKRYVENDLGQPLKGGRWACPIHRGEGSNFEVKDQHFKCWSCGASGDLLDYVAARHGVPVVEAAELLDPSGAFVPRKAGPRSATVATSAPVPAPTPKAAPAAAWEDPQWQATVDRVVCEAEAFLWSSDGRAARAWLRARGLDDSTARRFRLGFNPHDFNTEPVDVLGPDKRNRPQGLWVRRGVVIPWVRPGSWYCAADDHFGDPSQRWVGANVRRLADDFTDPDKPKYHAVAGSERGHGYPWPECSAPGEPAIVCEGEFDALVGWQEAGWVANVVTFGGAGQKRETEDARAYLAACPDWLLTFDQDDAGDNAARAMARRASHRCRRLYLPPGVKDLTDLHVSGGPVLGWLRSEWARFGWPWPLRS